MKPLQQQILNYSPPRGKKLHWNAVPTLHFPLLASNISEDAFDKAVYPLLYDNASSTAEAFYTAESPPVSITDTFHEEMSPQMSNNAMLTTAEESGVVSSPVSADNSMSVKTFLVPSSVSSNALSVTNNGALSFPKMQVLSNGLLIDYVIIGYSHSQRLNCTFTNIILYFQRRYSTRERCN